MELLFVVRCGCDGPGFKYAGWRVRAREKGRNGVGSEGRGLVACGAVALLV